jgi:hypothetical protein
MEIFKFQMIKSKIPAARVLAAARDPNLSRTIEAKRKPRVILQLKRRDPSQRVASSTKPRAT